MADSIFVIRNTATDKFEAFGSKCAWVTSGAAKNAYNLHLGRPHTSYYNKDAHKFDDQTQYIIEEIYS